MNLNWQIIKVKQNDGRTEYQVSDDYPNKRTISYDFYTLQEAEICLNEEIIKQKGKQHEFHKGMV